MEEFIKGITLSDIQKIVQICFYTITIIVGLMTYKNARKSLLSPIHVEYQKHVINRLKDISADIVAEFDENNDIYFGRAKYYEQNANDLYDAYEEHCRTNEKDTFVFENFSSMQYIISRINKKDLIASDPFVPEKIKESLAAYYAGYVDSELSAHDKVSKYYKSNIFLLYKNNDRERFSATFNNDMLEVLGNDGFDIEGRMEKTNKIREQIQGYFNSYIQ